MSESVGDPVVVGLAGIRAYVELATAGPWREVTVFGGRAEVHPLDLVIRGVRHDADARFIARARSDLPLLLGVTEAAEAYFSYVKRWPGSLDWGAAGVWSLLGPLHAALARLGAGS